MKAITGQKVAHRSPIGCVLWLQTFMHLSQRGSDPQQLLCRGARFAASPCIPPVPKKNASSFLEATIVDRFSKTQRHMKDNLFVHRRVKFENDISNNNNMAGHEKEVTLPRRNQTSSGTSLRFGAGLCHNLAGLGAGLSL